VHLSCYSDSFSVLLPFRHVNWKCVWGGSRHRLWPSIQSRVTLTGGVAHLQVGRIASFHKSLSPSVTVLCEDYLFIHSRSDGKFFSFCFIFKDLVLQVSSHVQKLHTLFINIIMFLCKTIRSHENVACYINLLVHVLAVEDFMPLKLRVKSSWGGGGGLESGK